MPQNTEAIQFADIIEALTGDDPADELAVPTEPYAEPYYDERAWRWHDGEDDWVHLARGALKFSRADSLADIVDELESDPGWRRQPYLNAFVTPAGKTFHFAPDIAGATSEQLKRTRAARAAGLDRYDVAASQRMLTKLAERETATRQYLTTLRVEALAGVDRILDQIAALPAKWRDRAPCPPAGPWPLLPSETPTEPLEPLRPERLPE